MPENLFQNELIRVGDCIPKGRDKPCVTLLAAQLWTLALGGDMAATKILLDRMLGRPFQGAEAQVSDYPMMLEEFQAEMAKRINQVGELEE